MLPLQILPRDIFTFNMEIPYYNWFYPLQHTEETAARAVPTDFISAYVKGVYVHFPFCASLCSYCPYVKTHIHDAELRDKYVSRLVTEIRSYAGDVKPQVECVFFGGGSPSLMSPEHFVAIMNALRSVFIIPPGCEITVEANAKSLSSELCAVFQAGGVSTVRLGVQSFNPQSRALYKLQATVEDIVNSSALARKYGLQVSFDLLFGHHGQEIGSFIADIDKAHALAPDTIEIYPLNLLSAPGRYWSLAADAGRQGLSAREKVRFFKAGCDRLKELGYYQWSGHGFARSADFDLLYHRCVYGTLGGYAGFGPAAISCGYEVMKWNHSDIGGYIEQVGTDSVPPYTARRISDTERRAKKIITELPYYGSCDFSEELRSPETSLSCATRLRDLRAAGAVAQNGNKLVVSETARLQYATMMFYLLPDGERELLGREIFYHCARLGNSFTADMLWL